MAELIQFPCPVCRAMLRLPLAMAGRQGPCPRCGSELVAPDPYQGTGARKVQQTPRLAPFEPFVDVPLPDPIEDVEQRATPRSSHGNSTQADSSGTNRAMEVPANDSAIPAGPKVQPLRAAPSLGIQPAVLVLSVLLSGVVCLIAGYLIGARSDWLVARAPHPVFPRVESPVPPKPADEATPVLVKPAVVPRETPEPVVDPVEPIPHLQEEKASTGPKKASALAEAALKAFLEAPDWASRNAHVLRPSDVRAAMEEYSRRHPDGATPWKSISVENSYTDKTTGFTLFIFKVTTELHPSGFPVAVAESESGWNVDWESFVEFRDDHFRIFADGPPERSGRFHVLVSTPPESRAANTANEHFASFLLDPPLPGRQKLAYVRKDAEIHPQLAAATASGGIFTPVIELAKRRTPDGKTYLEITGIVKNDWLPRLK